MAYRSCPHCTFGTIRTVDGSQQRCGMCAGTGSIWTPDPAPGSSARPAGGAAARQASPRFRRVIFEGISNYKGDKKFIIFRHGRGSATFRSGVEYTGEFRWNRPSGEGVMDGGSYVIEGRFRRGMPHGDCTVAVVIDGEDGGTFGFFCPFKNSYPKGEGVLTFPNGARFEGKWNGHDHAKGDYISTSGNAYPALIRNGDMILKKGIFDKPKLARFCTFDLFTGGRCAFFGKERKGKT